MVVLASAVLAAPAPRREAQPARGSLQGRHHGDGRELYELTTIPSLEGSPRGLPAVHLAARLRACWASHAPRWATTDSAR
jgi:hypothetical protein